MKKLQPLKIIVTGTCILPLLFTDAIWLFCAKFQKDYKINVEVNQDMTYEIQLSPTTKERKTKTPTPINWNLLRGQIYQVLLPRKKSKDVRKPLCLAEIPGVLKILVFGLVPLKSPSFYFFLSFSFFHTKISTSFLILF
jgi:hypothetical protein